MDLTWTGREAVEMEPAMNLFRKSKKKNSV